jgi:hypothetical protein
MFSGVLQFSNNFCHVHFLNLVCEN